MRSGTCSTISSGGMVIFWEETAAWVTSSANHGHSYQVLVPLFWLSTIAIVIDVVL